MSEVYTPERWMVVKIEHPKETLYKVLAGWGGYLDGDSWRLNSGIIRVEDDGQNYIFHGHSGSRYVCHKECEGYTGTTFSIFERLKAQATEKNINVEVVIGRSYYEHMGD
jgi:hypothetical protein